MSSRSSANNTPPFFILTSSGGGGVGMRDGTPIEERGNGSVQSSVSSPPPHGVTHLPSFPFPAGVGACERANSVLSCVSSISNGDSLLLNHAMNSVMMGSSGYASMTNVGQGSDRQTAAAAADVNVFVRTSPSVRFVPTAPSSSSAAAEVEGAIGKTGVAAISSSGRHVGSPSSSRVRSGGSAIVSTLMQGHRPALPNHHTATNGNDSRSSSIVSASTIDCNNNRAGGKAAASSLPKSEAEMARSSAVKARFEHQERQKAFLKAAQERQLQRPTSPRGVNTGAPFSSTPSSSSSITKPLSATAVGNSSRRGSGGNTFTVQHTYTSPVRRALAASVSSSVAGGGGKGDNAKTLPSSPSLRLQIGSSVSVSKGKGGGGASGCGVGVNSPARKASPTTSVKGGATPTITPTVASGDFVRTPTIAPAWLRKQEEKAEGAASLEGDHTNIATVLMVESKAVLEGAAAATMSSPPPAATTYQSHGERFLAQYHNTNNSNNKRKAHEAPLFFSTTATPNAEGVMSAQRRSSPPLPTPLATRTTYGGGGGSLPLRNASTTTTSPPRGPSLTRRLFAPAIEIDAGLATSSSEAAAAALSLNASALGGVVLGAVQPIHTINPLAAFAAAEGERREARLLAIEMLVKSHHEQMGPHSKSNRSSNGHKRMNDSTATPRRGALSPSMTKTVRIADSIDAMAFYSLPTSREGCGGVHNVAASARISGVMSVGGSMMVENIPSLNTNSTAPHPSAVISPTFVDYARLTVGPREASCLMPSTTLSSAMFLTYQVRSYTAYTCCLCGAAFDADAMASHHMQCLTAINDTLRRLKQHPLCGLVRHPAASCGHLLGCTTSHLGRVASAAGMSASMRPHSPFSHSSFDNANNPVSSPQVTRNVPPSHSPMPTRKAYAMAAADAFASFTVACNGCGEAWPVDEALDHFVLCAEERGVDVGGGGGVEVAGGDAITVSADGTTMDATAHTNTLQGFLAAIGAASVTEDDDAKQQGGGRGGPISAPAAADKNSFKSDTVGEGTASRLNPAHNSSSHQSLDRYMMLMEAIPPPLMPHQAMLSPRQREALARQQQQQHQQGNEEASRIGLHTAAQTPQRAGISLPTVPRPMNPQYPLLARFPSPLAMASHNNSTSNTTMSQQHHVNHVSPVSETRCLSAVNSIMRRGGSGSLPRTVVVMEGDYHTNNMGGGAGPSRSSTPSPPLLSSPRRLSRDAATCAAVSQAIAMAVGGAGGYKGYNAVTYSRQNSLAAASTHSGGGGRLSPPMDNAHHPRVRGPSAEDGRYMETRLSHVSPFAPARQRVGVAETAGPVHVVAVCEEGAAAAGGGVASYYSTDLVAVHPYAHIGAGGVSKLCAAGSLGPPL